MRADIHDGPEHTLQSEAGYSNARPHQPEVDKTSCTARPDHTDGSKRELPSSGLMSASAGCGHVAPCAIFCHVPILLQKSFSTVIKIFSRPLMRFSDKYVRDLVS